jgi:hypothetical protein
MTLPDGSDGRAAPLTPLDPAEEIQKGTPSGTAPSGAPDRAIRRAPGPEGLPYSAGGGKVR